MAKAKSDYPGARAFKKDRRGYYTSMRKRIDDFDYTSTRLRASTKEDLIKECKTWENQIGFQKLAIAHIEEIRKENLYTVEKFLTSYHERAIGIKGNPWKSNTKQDSKYILRSILKDERFASLELVKVTRKDVKDFLADKRFQGLAERHLKITRYLKTAFNIAIQDDDKELLPNDVIIEFNPVIGIPCTTSYVPIKPLDDEHEVKLLQYVQGKPFWGALITLVLDAGFRFQELA
jgi:hypothetical protein